MNDLKASRGKSYLAAGIALGAIALVIGLIYWGVFGKSGKDDDYVNVPENPPPLIDVIITPEPLNLNAGAGLVTYTYKVTNPGNVTVDNVTIVDDKVTANYVSGDTNADKQLQTNETWIYTGSMTLDVTTTNTATVKGSANGLTATDTASSTVVVTPVVEGGKIPDTGTHLYGILLAGIVLTLLGAVGWRRRKRYE